MKHFFALLGFAFCFPAGAALFGKAPAPTDAVEPPKTIAVKSNPQEEKTRPEERTRQEKIAPKKLVARPAKPANSKDTPEYRTKLMAFRKAAEILEAE